MRRSSLLRTSLLWLSVSALSVLVACSETRERRSLWVSGAASATVESLDAEIAERDITLAGGADGSSGLSDVAELNVVMDRAYVALATGDVATAQRLFALLESEMGERLRRTGMATSMTTMLDERLKDYTGRFHEHTLVPAFAALSESISGSVNVSAFAQRIGLARVSLEQTRPGNPLQDDPATATVYTPLESYVGAAILSSRGHGDAPVYTRWLETALGEGSRRASTVSGAFGRPSHGAVRVHVLQFLGVAPELSSGSVKADAALISLVSGATQVPERSVRNHSVTSLPVSAVGQAKSVVPIAVTINGVMVASERLLDMNQVLKQAVARTQSAEAARALGRRLLVAGALQGSTGNGPLAIAGTYLKSVTEDADTRSWSLLPAAVMASSQEYAAGRLEVRCGDTQIGLDCPGGSTFIVLVFQPAEGKTLSLLTGRLDAP